MHNEDTLVGGPLNRTDKNRAEIAGLTKDQQKAYQGLIEFINKPFNRNDFKRALVGAGGVGKTFVLKTILKNCNISFSQIGVSAPSHKACRVIRDSLAGLPVNVNTIQSDYGMRPDYNIDKFNERDIQFSRQGRIKVEDYNLYVVDEASMINKALFNYMCKALVNNCCKLLLLGDVDQVPPVNELEPSAFKNVTTYRLTQIVRQDEDNPIRKICSMLRNDVEHYSFTFLNYISTHKSEFDSTMTKGFMVCNSAEFQHQVELQFSDEAITKNTDYVKVIAYTNIAVSAWNKFIREAIIKNSEKSVITKNDLITSYITLVNEFKEIIIRNSEDYIVRDIANYTHPKYDIKGFMVKFQAVHGGQVTSPLFVLDHRDRYSIKKYCQLCNDLIEQAKNAPKQQRAAKWKKYFEFRESCLILINIAKADGTVLHYRNLDYGFSLTSHKSQGSTYNVSMVDINDIVYDKNGHPYNNAKDINRRLYVAVSRAKEKVILRYG